MRQIIRSPADLPVFFDFISKLDLAGKEWLLSFEPVRKPKSVPQLRLYFLWLKCIEDDTETDIKTLDCYFKDKYLGKEIKTFRGKEFEVPVSKADLDTKQMHYFLEAVRLEAMQEMNISLPLPEEQGFDQFYAEYS
ncbi:MAG: hypothetical protein PHE17_17965 [Thiothrix sp.]|uniref:hypothetical protein n=1 Tax=Thiothrix sp. TaxID=1032 RepID=UPI002616C728|nr:hypothetical protein [Thiothrix sp.]MDD5394907.1 hypothetical protein [Thiothrix sp.]